MNGLDGRAIVVAVDRSESSDKVLGWALDNLYKAGDKIHLVHVIKPGQTVVMTTDIGVDGVIEDDPETKRKAEEEAIAYVKEHFETKLAAAQLPFETHVVRAPLDTDSIGIVLCRLAAQLNASALVMAKHNKGAIREFLLGSVTNYCVHHCKQPVMVLHTE